MSVRLRNISAAIQTVTVVLPDHTFSKQVLPLNYLWMSDGDYAGIIPPLPASLPTIWEVDLNPGPIPPSPPPDPLPSDIYTTDDLPEGLANRYFTSTRAQQAINNVNVGSGEGVFKEYSGGTFKWRSLVAGPGIVVTGAADEITIEATGPTGSTDQKESCVVATTAALPACTYYNGPGNDGVGATLTGNATGALPPQDGNGLAVNFRLLVKKQAAALQNGIYVVTAVGDGLNPFVLTRATDFDGSPTGLVNGGEFVFVAKGTIHRGTSWVVGVITAPAIFGTTNIVWRSASLQAAYSVGGNTLITNATEGAITIAGTETLEVTTTGGLHVNGGLLYVQGSLLQVDGATALYSAVFSNSSSGYALQASTGGGTGDAIFAYADGASASAISGENNSATSATLKLRNNNVSGAVLQLLGDTSGALDILVPASFTPYSLTLPSDAGIANQLLQTDGSGVLSWATGAGSFLEADVTILPAAMKDLVANPVILIPAPGAGKYIEVYSVDVFMNYNSVAYNWAPIDQLEFRYNTAGTDSLIAFNVNDYNTVGDIRYRLSPKEAVKLFKSPLDALNSALTLTLSGADATLGDSAFKMRIYYYILTAIM